MLLALFFAFGIYAIHATRQLRRYQSEVLQRNRQDTQQLLRIQQDAYQLAVLVRDMVLTGGEASASAAPAPAPRQPRLPALRQPPFAISGLEFRRIRIDLNQALDEESRLAPAGRGAGQRRQLGEQLAQFWSVSDQVFRLARLGYHQPAQDLVQRELLPQRRVINAMVSGWLAENRLQESRTQAAMEAIYARISRNFLWLTLVLLGLGAAIAAWAIRANRQAFRQMESLARQLDQRSRQLEQVNWRMLQVQEETLQHVSRDLHDEFGQILTAVGAALARAERPPSPDPSAAVPEIRRARQAVQEAQGKIRNLSQMLRPTLLDDFGLEKTLAWYVEQYGRQTGLAARLQCSGAIPFLPTDRAIHLYRIAQEALTNAARHAGARRVTVALKSEEGLLTLEIADDGRGFAVHSVTNGLGLVGMRQRAESLGGSLSLESGAGTVVRVRIPTAQPAQTAKAGEAG